MSQSADNATLSKILTITGNVQSDVRNYIRKQKGKPAARAPESTQELQDRVLAALDEISKRVKEVK